MGTNYINANPGQLVRLVIQTTSPSPTTSMRQEIFLATENQLIYTLQEQPISQQATEFFIDGVSQAVGIDYTVDGYTVTYIGEVVINAGTEISIKYFPRISNGYGNRIDGYVPIIDSVYYPDLTLAAGFPREMTRLGVGLYTFGLQIPTGVTALGSYTISAYWNDGENMNWETYIVQVNRAFGNSSITPI
jgi:hypothetical protein